MAVNHIVTRGFANGTLVGTIALVVTRGYSIGSVVENLIDNDNTPTAANLVDVSGGASGNLIDNDSTPTNANLIDVT